MLWKNYFLEQTFIVYVCFHAVSYCLVLFASFLTSNLRLWNSSVRVHNFDERF